MPWDSASFLSSAEEHDARAVQADIPRAVGLYSDLDLNTWRMKLDGADHAERYPQYNSNTNLWAYLASVPDDLTTCVQLRLKLISGAVLAADHCQP